VLILVALVLIFVTAFVLAWTRERRWLLLNKVCWVLAVLIAVAFSCWLGAQ
jgi:uncharacterized membrane protein